MQLIGELMLNYRAWAGRKRQEHHGMVDNGVSLNRAGKVGYCKWDAEEKLFCCRPEAEAD